MSSLRRLSNVLAALRVLDIELRDRRLFLTLAVLAALFAASVAMCLKTVATPPWPHRFGDFHALWASGVIAHDGAAALNYDADALHARQVALGVPPAEHNPFPFPPTFLLLLAPLGALGRGAAFALFMGLTFAGYVWATAGGRKRAWPHLIGALVAPATGVTLLAGQSGFLSAGLMLGGLRLSQARPLAAGVLLGLLAYKPQLGLLVPVALVSAGQWRTFAAAGATVLLCILTSSAVFGGDIWLSWLASLGAYVHFAMIDHLMPTIAANLRMAGAPAAAANAAQVAAALFVAAVVWRAFRDGVTPRATALLVVGTFAATPHALIYDLPMTTFAVTWLLTERVGAAGGLHLSEIVALASWLALPLAMIGLGASVPPISWAPELALFGLLAAPSRRKRADGPGDPRLDDAGDQPPEATSARRPGRLRHLI